MTLTPTQLRADLYRLLDQVIDTGQPLLISRGGTTLRISLVARAEEHADPLAFAPLCADLVAGDPADLVHAEVSAAWTAGKGL